MKKYNLSEIMKRAWELKREDKDNLFSACLTLAWEEKKNVKEFTGFAQFGQYTFKLWEKASMRRIYVADAKNRSCGYIDLVTGKNVNPSGLYLYRDLMNEFKSCYILK